MDRSWVNQVAEVIDIPFCVAGGIRTIESAESVLHRGADKISVNTPALEDPQLIDALVDRFGSQCVVLGVDSREIDGDYRVYQNTGDPEKTVSAERDSVDWIREAQERGIGEVVLNCMNQDGVREGYDCAQLRAIRNVCQVPLIASGGAGNKQHFADVFRECNVDGALAASVFHSGNIHIADLKSYLLKESVYIRPV